MTMSQSPEQSLEYQLESLRSINTAESAERVLQGIKQRIRWQRRQVLAASCGACVSAIGTIHFVLQGDPFGYFALSLSTAALVFTAWRSARNAVSLAALKSGTSLLASWRMELKRQLRHTLFAQLAAALFATLTAWVVWRYGIPSLKSSLYLAMAAGICTFAAYQYLVIRPSLQRELEVLDQDG
jgi:hypothetical protein